MLPVSHSARTPWARCAVVLAPGLALLMVALSLGARTPAGLAALGAAGLIHLAMVVFAVPAILGRREVSSVDAALTRFLQRALAVSDVDEVAEAFVTAVHGALGPTRAVLVAPSADGGVRVLPSIGESPDL